MADTRTSDSTAVRRYSSELGFSIIELLVVLFLVATVSGSAALSATNLRSRINLALAAGQVAFDLNLARVRAIAANTDYRIQFAPGSTRYQLQSVHGVIEPIGAAIDLPPGVIVESCNGRDGGLQFRPRGSAASFGTVVLASASLTRRVIVNIAGHVRISE